MQYNKDNITLGFYGIQDIEDKEYPLLSHDHGLALFHKGKLLQQIQLERITRRKHDHLLKDEIYALLKEIGLLGDPNVDFVFANNIIGNAFCDKTGSIRFEASLQNKLANTLTAAKGWYLGKPVDGYMISHELAHLYSCIPFYGLFKPDSLLFHFDGGASLSNHSLWSYEHNGPKLLHAGWELKYLSELYDTNFLVFQLMKGSKKNQLGVPGKFMGYASLGMHDLKIEKWLRENAFFTHSWGSRNDFIKSLNKYFNLSVQNIDNKIDIFKNISATIQHVFIADSLNFMKKWQRELHKKYLYFSGGCALNIKLNKALLDEGLFEDIFIPPCCNDSGLALGAAVALEVAKGHKIEQQSNFLNHVFHEQTSTWDEALLHNIAELIEQGEMIALCNGHGEIGPRALGNRSIIARADNKELADKISRKVKGREWYRPVAPIMLEKHAKKFAGKDDIHHLASKMLLEFDILPEYRKTLEGVVHEDGTSRIQVIEYEQNGFLYELLCLLENKEIHALINTSFNAAVEPIVHTHEDALRSAKKMGIKHLVLDYKLIRI